MLSTERLNQVIEHAAGDMTATVEAGCTIDNFQRTFSKHGQRLAADPMQPETATVGGLLATAESGTLRIRYGAVRDLVLGLELALPDGSLIRAGGKVVKNVAGYDLTKLVIGSLGTLGVITRAVFRLHPIPVATATYSTVVPTASEATKLVLSILNSQLVYTGLQIRATRAHEFAVDIRFEGIPESLEDQHVKLSQIGGGCRFELRSRYGRRASNFLSTTAVRSSVNVACCRLKLVRFAMHCSATRTRLGSQPAW